jgi:hypothetical protein
MKLHIDKDWFETMAAKEGNLKIGAGRSKCTPAYDGCTCSCHRSPGMLHVTACCRPSKGDLEALKFCEKINARKRDRHPPLRAIGTACRPLLNRRLNTL